MKNKVYSTCSLIPYHSYHLFVLVILFGLSSCSSRYWYRTKVNVRDQEDRVKEVSEIHKTDSTAKASVEDNHMFTYQESLSREGYDSIENKTVREPVVIQKEEIKKVRPNVKRPSSTIHSPSTDRSANPNTFFWAGVISILLGLLVIGIGALVSVGDAFMAYAIMGTMFLFFGVLFLLLAVIINALYE